MSDIAVLPVAADLAVLPVEAELAVLPVAAEPAVLSVVANPSIESSSPGTEVSGNNNNNNIAGGSYSPLLPLVAPLEGNNNNSPADIAGGSDSPLLPSAPALEVIASNRVEDNRDGSNRDDGVWNTVRGKRSVKPVIGTSEGSGLKGVPPRALTWFQFSVTRLEENTSDQAVLRHLQSHGIEVKEVWMLSSQIEGTKTAKVRVAREHKERAKAPSLWPVHSRIKDWEFDRNKINNKIKNNNNNNNN